jgi:hypothetical protein
MKSTQKNKLLMGTLVININGNGTIGKRLVQIFGFIRKWLLERSEDQ